MWLSHGLEMKIIQFLHSRYVKIEAQQNNGDWSRRQSRKIGSSLPRMNRSDKIYNVEQFSLKTNCKLAERLLYNQGCKKNPQGIQ